MMDGEEIHINKQSTLNYDEVFSDGNGTEKQQMVEGHITNEGGNFQNQIPSEGYSTQYNESMQYIE